MSLSTTENLQYLEDRWDDRIAAQLDEAELLRYRSNLLGSDLRITNFGGGNTSSKIQESDPLDGSEKAVLWVKGSGGDLGSMKREGFATLYLDKLLALEQRYRGVEHEDEIVDLYPLCAFGKNGVAASIDTPLHGFLPFAHVDHLHPDWGIALAAAENGREKMEAFNQRFGHKLVWLPWQRPGFELAMMLRRAIAEHPDCDGIVLAGHGLFTWGETQRACYLNSITIIDQLGQFVNEHIEAKTLFGGAKYATIENHRELAVDIFPYLRGQLSQQQRKIGSYSDLPEVLQFVNSNDAKQLAFLGTSCPDHFIRTKIRPLFVDWNPANYSETGKDRALEALRTAIHTGLAAYRKEYQDYYAEFVRPESPAMRDPNPTVVLIPGIGMFNFGKNKAEARITGEFYINAIHVMEGSTALGGYVALPLSEAFRIEYWPLEEAKIRRQPPEKELSRKIVMVVGGASGIGKAVAVLAAQRGAHVVVADRSYVDAQAVASEAITAGGKETAIASAIDITQREAIRASLREIVAHFGGLDVIITTAAIFPSSPTGTISDEQWATTLDVNVTANHRLAGEAAAILQEQDLDGAIVLTSSANAVVPKRGSEAYDVSKAALSHLVRELAVGLAPNIRVNGISPATVVKGSTMFPRDRVIASLEKYGLAFEPEASDERLRELLAGFYAQRTLTHVPIEPEDCAQAILFLAGDKTRCTTGHMIPVDGGLSDAFLR